MPVVRQIGLDNTQEYVQQAPRFTAEQFGASTYRAVGEAGQAIGRLGLVLQENKQKLDTTAAEDARNKAAVELNDKTNEVLAKFQGDKIEERRQALEQAQVEIEQKYSSQLKGGAQKLFQRAFSSTKASNTIQVADKSAADIARYEDDVFNTSIEAFKSDYIASGDSSIIAKAKGRFEAYAAKKGLPEDFAARKILETESDFNAARAIAVGQTSALKAKQFVEANKAGFTPEQYASVLDKVQPAAEVEEATLAAREFYEKNSRLTNEELVAQADVQIKNPLAKQKLIDIVDKQKEIALKTNQAAKANAFKNAMDTGSYPVGDASFTPIEQRLLKTLVVARDNKEANSNFFDREMDVVASGADLSDMPNRIADGVERGELSKAQAYSLAITYLSATAKADISQDLAKHTQKKEMDELIKAFTGASDDKKIDFIRADTLVRQAIANEESARGKKLTYKEQREVAARELVTFKKTGRGASDLSAQEFNAVEIDDGAIRKYADRVGIPIGGKIGGVFGIGSSTAKQDLIKIAKSFEPSAQLEGFDDDSIKAFIKYKIKYGNEPR